MRVQSALADLARRFGDELAKLEQLDGKSDEKTVKDACAITLGLLYEYVPLLGFIIRSTNVRNAFEIYAPLQRLCQSVLEPSVSPSKRTTRLILSSEWTYQPHVYPEKDFLPSYVLIGLPAPESSNPLLLPLAGHELGHSLWRAHTLGNDLHLSAVRAVINTIINNRNKFTETYQSEISEFEIETASTNELINFLADHIKFFSICARMDKIPSGRNILRFCGTEALWRFLSQSVCVPGLTSPLDAESGRISPPDDESSEPY